MLYLFNPNKLIRYIMLVHISEMGNLKPREIKYVIQVHSAYMLLRLEFRFGLVMPKLGPYHLIFVKYLM